MGRKKKIDLSIGVNARVELGDLAYDVSPEVAFELIKMLDSAQEDWGFTEKVYKHFSKLHTVYLALEKEDKANEQC